MLLKIAPIWLLQPGVSARIVAAQIFSLEYSQLGDLLVGISSGKRNLMKTYHNEVNSGRITKIASKNVLEFFRQSR